jgi:glucokinase
MAFLGIEIGGTKLQIVAGTAQGTIVERLRFQVDKAAGGEGIRRQIASALPELKARHAVAAIGVGFGGPLDWRHGRIAQSFQIPGWDGFPLADWLRTESGLPVTVDNDANVAALGEAIAGAGTNCDPVLWLNCGSGVGSGLVVEGRIYHGRPPGEFEIGHVPLDLQGVTLEDRCSGWAVDGRVRFEAANDPGSVLAEQVRERTLERGTEGGEACCLGPAIAAGCPVAGRLVDEVARELGFALSHAVYLVSPEVVVFGGGLSLIGEPLRVALASALTDFLLPTFRPGPRVVQAGLGEDSVPCGALLLAAQAAAAH